MASLGTSDGATVIARRQVRNVVSAIRHIVNVSVRNEVSVLTTLTGAPATTEPVESLTVPTNVAPPPVLA